MPFLPSKASFFFSPLINQPKERSSDSSQEIQGRRESILELAFELSEEGSPPSLDARRIHDWNPCHQSHGRACLRMEQVPSQAKPGDRDT